MADVGLLLLAQIPIVGHPENTLYALSRSLGVIVAVGSAATILASAAGEYIANRLSLRPSPGVAPGRRHYLSLAIAFTLFAVYGALLPFNYAPLSIHEAVDRFLSIPYLRLGVGQERADWVASILFFMPLGYLWLGAAVTDRASRMFAAMIAMVTIVGCAVLSLGIEFAQIWYPPRTVSQNDVLAETSGATLGVMIWLLLGQVISDWLRSHWHLRGGFDGIQRLLQVYAVVVIAYSVMPLDVVLGPAELRLKYQEGRIECLPLADLSRGAMPWHVPIVHAALWAPLGILAHRGLLRRADAARSTGRALSIGALILLGVEAVRLCVFSRYSSATDVLMGLFGLGGGIVVSECWHKVELLSDSSRLLRLGRTSITMWLGLAGLYAMAAVYVASAPFEFPGNPFLQRERFAGFWGAPFATLYWGSKLNALTEVLQKVVLFVPLGALLGRCVVILEWPAILRRIVFGLTIAAAAGIALAMKMLQVFETAHVVDVTDVLLAAVGAGIGLCFVAVATRASPRPRGSAAVGVVAVLWLMILLGVVSYVGVRAHCGPADSDGTSFVDAKPGAVGAKGDVLQPAAGLKPHVPPFMDAGLSYPDLMGCRFTETPPDRLQVPHFVPIEIPDFHGELSIWGATGRDRRGHVWFGISTIGGSDSPAHLCEYVPESGAAIDRGDVISELKRAGFHRLGESQQKIHSRIIHGSDGNLYFASMDEQGEEENGGKLPLWGSHFWRLRLPENRWEHLFSAPEGLIAVAGAGEWVYALGYFGHVLYQYHVASGEVHSVIVGAVDGHISRNFICDHRGHAYVPRLRRAANGQDVQVSLVEFDTGLHELGETPLRHYLNKKPTDSHGIVGFQHLTDQSIAFCTDAGFLYRIVPAENKAAEVSELSWFHPQGEAYVASMFTFSGAKYLLGVSRRQDRYEWLVFDLEKRASTAVPIPRSEAVHQASYVYGSVTRDNDGAFYLVGGRQQPGLPLASELERALGGMDVKSEDLRAVRGASEVRDLPIMYRLTFAQPAKPGNEALHAEVIGVHLDEGWFRDSFRRDVLEGWLAAAPTANGFFRADLDRQWQPRTEQVATLVSQGRILFTLSQGFELTGQSSYRDAVRSGANFLLEHFVDKQYGGLFASVSPAGKVLGTEKDTYGQAFAILGLSHAARITGDKRYLQAAMDCWRAMRKKLRHPRGGFYQKTDREFHSVPGAISQNHLMHLFESLLALCDATGSEEVLADAKELADFVLNGLYQEQGGYIPEWFDADWSPLPSGKGGYVEIGHQVEWAYLLSWAHDKGFPERCLVVGHRLIDFAMRSGYDSREGGLFASCGYEPGTASKGPKGLWQQCEFQRALMRYAARHGRDDLWEPLDKSLSFMKRTMHDSDYGGWYLTPQPDTSGSADGSKGSVWNCGYHLSGMYVEGLRLCKAAGKSDVPARQNASAK